MQPVKMSAMFKKQRGMTLLELVVVLTITAVLAAATLQFSGGMRESVAFQQTQDRVQAIKNAIINVQTINGVPVVSGFAADMGRLPNCLQELLANPYTCSTATSALTNPLWGSIGSCVSASGTAIDTSTHCAQLSGVWYAYGLCMAAGSPSTLEIQSACVAPATWTQLLPSNFNMGWRGPYLQTSNSPTTQNAYSDGWGNDIYLGTLPLTSLTAPFLLPASPCSVAETLSSNNTPYCLLPDPYNYGWYYSPNISTVSIINSGIASGTYLIGTYATLQSIGSDRLPDYVSTTTTIAFTNAIGTYPADYPANPLSTAPTAASPNPTPVPVIQQQGWQFNLGGAPLGYYLPPTNITVNVQAQGGSTYTTASFASGGCSMLGGTPSGANCVVTQAMCNVLGGTWNPYSSSCSFNAVPQSICNTLGGAWSAASSTCYQPSTALSSNTCTSTDLNGTWIVSTSTCNNFAPTTSTGCGYVNGTWNNGTCSPLPYTPPLIAAPTSANCTAANGGVWNGSTCAFGNTLPLQSLCANAGGTWDSTHLTCTLEMDLTTCINLGGTQENNNQCQFTAKASAGTPSLSDTCQNLFFSPVTPTGVWTSNTLTCTLTPTTPLTYFQGLCNALGGFWSGTACTIGAPALSMVSSQCASTGGCSPLTTSAQNICLNIFYRDFSLPTWVAGTAPPIAVATASASVPNDSKSHAVSFSGLSSFDLLNTLWIGNPPISITTNPVSIPAGTNAFSVTEANIGGGCDGSSYMNAPYPANHSAAPVPQNFTPGMPLVFNW